MYETLYKNTISEDVILTSLPTKSLATETANRLGCVTNWRSDIYNRLSNKDSEVTQGFLEASGIREIVDIATLNLYAKFDKGMCPLTIVSFLKMPLRRVGSLCRKFTPQD